MYKKKTQLVYMLKGKLRSAFVEEAGGTRGAIVHDISPGESTFYPQGLVHYQQNLECEEASFVAAVNSEDPGMVPMATFLALPEEAIEVRTDDVVAPSGARPCSVYRTTIDCFMALGWLVDQSKPVGNRRVASNFADENLPH